jgi:hypothetical protein
MPHPAMSLLLLRVNDLSGKATTTVSYEFPLSDVRRPVLISSLHLTISIHRISIIGIHT